MKRNLSDVSSAEIIGTTAVVLSLIFVGVQIRDGNREARATTIQSTLNSEMELIAILTENASTWDKVITGAPLASGEEMRKGILLYNLLMTRERIDIINSNLDILKPSHGKVAYLLFV